MNDLALDEFAHLLFDGEEEVLEKESFAKKMTPIAPLTTTQLRSRQKKEVQLYDTWKQAPTKQNLTPLMKSLSNITNMYTQRHATSWAIPRSAVEAEVKIKTLQALNTFDPSYGVKLSTHLQHQLKSVGRFIKKYNNFGKIPEQRQRRIGEFKRAKTELHDMHGREPTTQEMSEFMSWPMSEVALLEIEIRADITGGEETGAVTTFERSKDSDILKLIYYELTPEEKLVYEYTLGAHGKQELGTTAIAKQLNMAAAKVSRIKKKIANKMQVYT
ncbi:hypothetical protein LCGC14_0147590 [marine sediment metagenome]|uniref:Uncharacterized protein n=1 Tax=marine sediment metagenome TaxID=412755 RepID=A0A0F9VFR7_9ZZZZ